MTPISLSFQKHFDLMHLLLTQSKIFFVQQQGLSKALEKTRKVVKNQKKENYVGNEINNNKNNKF